MLNAGVALLAFLKDILLAAYTGTSVEADALTIAYFLPDSMGNNILAMSIAVVCVPLFSRLHAMGHSFRLRRNIHGVTAFFLAVSAGLVLIGYLFSRPLIQAFAGAEGGQALAEQTLPLLNILLPSMVLFVVIAVGTAVLQTFGRFLVPAMVPMIGHLTVVAVTVGLLAAGVPADPGIRWIAVSLTGGFAIMALIIGASWYRTLQRDNRRERTEPVLAAGEGRRDLREMLQLLLPYAIVLASMQGVYLAERFLLTNYETGAAAALNYAFRLSQLPIWVFVAAISAVMLPSLTKHLTLGDTKAAHSIMSQAFRNTLLIVLPLMLYLFVLREPITVALFQRGAFDGRSVSLTVGLLEGYALTILSQAFSFVCLRYFLAKRKITSAMLVHVGCSALTVLLDWALLPLLGIRAIGYGAAIGSLLNALLIYVLYRQTSGSASAGRKGDLKRGMQVVLPALAMLLVFAAGWRLLPVQGTGTAMGFIVLTGSLYLAVYFLLANKHWRDAIQSLLGEGKRG